MIKTEVVKEALPLFLTGSRSKGVLIIHGFTGYPGEYYELANALYEEGYTVSLPRLPGHGTGKKDFMQTNWRDWLNHVQSAYQELQKTCSSVYIIGLSMGGVLTLILSSEFDPERIVLLAPAMAIKNRLFYLTPLLKFFIKEMPKTWIPDENDSEDVRTLGREYWSTNFPVQSASLFKLQRIARRRLKKISCPTLMMLSVIDDTVPVRAGKIIRKGLKNSTVKEMILQNSPHVLVSGKEKEIIKNEVIQWLNQGEKNA